MHPQFATIPYASHEVRLSGRQWIVAGTLIVLALVLTPWVWERVEPFRPSPDYRIPYALSNDYWMFGRYCRDAVSKGKTLVVGDSVIWGQYVASDQTLPHHLNELVGDDRFANLGVDGMHPAALAGLLRYYGRPIARQNVVLHCNLLWMSSTKHDLQIDKEFQFNHPTLVPQFVPRIPCYTEPYSNRVSIAIERHVPFFAWADHLRLAYFDRKDIPAWTLDHPYESPAGAVTLKLPAPEAGPQHEPIPWTDRQLTRQDFPWVKLDGSFQWRSFRQAVDTLTARGNRVFVVVGPFNEHMLTAPSLETYSGRNAEVAAWLKEQGIPHYVPQALPSQQYADASHPLGDGYAALAKQLLENDAFARFCGDHQAAGAVAGGTR